MPAVLAGLLRLLTLFGQWLMQRVGVLTLSGGVTYFGQEVGLVQPIIDAIGDMLADTALAGADGFLAIAVGQFGQALSGIPSAYALMAGYPAWAVEALAAVGVWKAMAMLLSLVVTRFVMDAIPRRGFDRGRGRDGEDT